MESSRRGLSNDVAEHRSILKNNKNAYYPRFIFPPITGKHSLKQVFCFYCEVFIQGRILTKKTRLKKIKKFLNFRARKRTYC